MIQIRPKINNDLRTSKDSRKVFQEKLFSMSVEAGLEFKR
jgi:hypothetical protein